MPATFSEELEQLVRKHLAAPPQWGDDFFPLLDALEGASVRIAEEADRYRFRNEDESEWREWQRELKRGQKRVA